MGVIKVLIIDDEGFFCDLVKMNLELSGRYEVTIACEGRTGVNLAGKVKPDIILLDIAMPKMSGFDVLQALKKNASTISIPVIMLSSLTDGKTRVRASSLYSQHYVTKPITTDKLMEKIDWVLATGRKK